MSNWLALEEKRINLQNEIDSQQTKIERNKQGQFATPFKLAVNIIETTLKYSILPANEIRFLEPAVGLGAFYSALLKVNEGVIPSYALGIEKNRRIARSSSKLWKNQGIKILNKDFTKCISPTEEKDKFNILITNPPYVRHHHLSKKEKERLKQLVNERLNLNNDGLMGLYGYFLLISHKWLQKDAISSWLIPREFMDVKYGKIIKKYLTEKVNLLQIHCFDINDVQFDSAEVTSAVIIYKNTIPNDDNNIKFTYGSDICNPNITINISLSKVKRLEKWSTIFLENTLTHANTFEGTRLGDIFKVKRGIATGANDFFIINKKIIEKHEIPEKFLIPTLPAPRFLTSRTIEKNLIEDSPTNQLYILNINLDKKELKKQYPKTYEYILIGEKEKINRLYLTKSRKIWYKMEERKSAPIICSYSGRKSKKGESIKFFRNKSKAIVINSYYNLYPKPIIFEKIKDTEEFFDLIFNELIKINQPEILKHGRSYGGGLNKIEPKELENVIIPYQFAGLKNPIQTLII
jgi:hypothetical protein